MNPATQVITSTYDHSHEFWRLSAASIEPTNHIATSPQVPILHIDTSCSRNLCDNVTASSRDDRTSIELFPGSFCEWTKSLIAIAQARDLRPPDGVIERHPGYMAEFGRCDRRMQGQSICSARSGETRASVWHARPTADRSPRPEPVQSSGQAERILEIR